MFLQKFGEAASNPQTFNKSVFTKESYKSAVNGDNNTNGYAVIKITPDARQGFADEADAEIKGVVKNNFEFDIEASWSDMAGVGSSLLPSGMDGVTGLLEKAQSIGNIAGFASMGSSFASKKIYQKSGYLTIKPEMRIVDWEGTGQPVISSLLLANYCLPREYANAAPVIKSVLGSVAQSFINELKEFDAAKKANDEEQEGKHGGVRGKVQTTVSEGYDFIKKSIKKSSDYTVDIFKNAGLQFNTNDINKDFDDLMALRSSPTPVKVEIGQYFSKNDMIIESISFQFSKEMTKNGPLYVDIVMGMSSRKILTGLNDIGLRPTTFKDGEDRILLIGKGSQATNASGVQ